MEKPLRNVVMAYMAGNLTCKQVAEAVTGYLENSLTFWERVRFQMHLGMCFGCRNCLNQMKHTIQTLQKLPTEPIPPQIRDELLERFRNWKKK